VRGLRLSHILIARYIHKVKSLPLSMSGESRGRRRTVVSRTNVFVTSKSFPLSTSRGRRTAVTQVTPP